VGPEEYTRHRAEVPQAEPTGADQESMDTSPSEPEPGVGRLQPFDHSSLEAILAEAAAAAAGSPGQGPLDGPASPGEEAGLAGATGAPAAGAPRPGEAPGPSPLRLLGAGDATPAPAAPSPLTPPAPRLDNPAGRSTPPAAGRDPFAAGARLPDPFAARPSPPELYARGESGTGPEPLARRAEPLSAEAAALLDILSSESATIPAEPAPPGPFGPGPRPTAGETDHLVGDPTPGEGSPAVGSRPDPAPAAAIPPGRTEVAARPAPLTAEATPPGEDAVACWSPADDDILPTHRPHGGGRRLLRRS